MGFEGLTSGERKRLQQGILKPEEAAVVSARAVAAGGGQGFWSSTWGQVIRAVGIAALNFIPVVGSIASTAVGAYDKQRAASMQQKATAEYRASAEALAARRASEAKRTVPAPVLETSPYPWFPDYGGIGQVTGYAGGSFNVQGATAEADPVGEVRAAFASFTPTHWVIFAAVIGMLVWAFFIRR